MSILRAFGLVSLSLGLSACALDGDTPMGEPLAADDALVGGRPDQRWPAAGYLVHGATLPTSANARVACGATLIAPNVVVTAAHCVLQAPNDVWAFGTGDVSSTALVRVISRRVHPRFHAAPQGALDVSYYLRNFDLATLVLASPVPGVQPARLPSAQAPTGCAYSAVGYRAEGRALARRRTTNACVQFHVELQSDPIFEVHPTDFSALCHGDGDEGSALVNGQPTRPVLHGIYVGSVTAGLTDCRRGTQFLNGYEAIRGFEDLLVQGIAEGQRR